jgi:signal peptidase I
VFQVPAGAYFVMGDNRDNTLDSRPRLTWGREAGWSVPLSDVVGRVNYIYWSGFDRLGRIGTALK